MDGQVMFQLGVQLTMMQSQVQQLAQMVQTQATQLQETRDLLEAFARQQGWTYSQDTKQWVELSPVQ